MKDTRYTKVDLERESEHFFSEKKNKAMIFLVSMFFRKKE